MKIKSVSLYNFRGFKNPIEIQFNDFTAFIGRNDVGKSTVLEALDIFFNDGKGVISIDRNDVNVENERIGNTEIVISVEFTNLPSSVVIDETHQTTLSEEYLLTEEGTLKIIKKYPKGGKAKVYIEACHPTLENCRDLLSKNNTALKKEVQALKLDCNKAANAEMRKAIWAHFKSQLDLQKTEIDCSKEDAKNIWQNLIAYLPTYSLFQSDRSNSDKDKEAQDPMKEAVKQILNDADLQIQLKSIAENVLSQLKSVTDATLEKLKEMNPEVASVLTPYIPNSNDLKWPDVFKNVSIHAEDNIPINKHGSGVKRLILLNFFRAEAERLRQNNNK